MRWWIVGTCLLPFLSGFGQRLVSIEQASGDFPHADVLCAMARVCRTKAHSRSKGRALRARLAVDNALRCPPLRSSRAVENTNLFTTLGR